jgi:Flp pilus assembly protein TadD
MAAPRKARPPAAADVLLQSAHAAYLAGRRDDAEATLRKLLAQEPSNTAAWNNLASLLGESGRPAEAEAAYRKAIAFNPDFVDFHVNFGIFLKTNNRLAEAEASFREAVTVKPGHAPTLAHLAQLLKEAGRLTEAEALFEQTLRLDPGYSLAHNNLGILLLDTERAGGAEVAFRKALALDPVFPEAHANLGNALKAQDRYVEAEGQYRKAIALRPEDRNFHNNLGAVLDDLGRLEEAEAAYRQALVLGPDYAAAHCNLGRLLQTQRRYPEAEEAYRKAIELDPKFTDAKLNLGLLLLTVGRYADAWPWHEARHFPDSKARRAMQPPFSFPQWQGESLAGKSLAVVLEQGHGDNIQFIRYAPLIKALGATRVTFVQPAPLVWFLATADGVDAITPDAVSLPAHDYWCFPLSLPMHLGTTVDSIPATLPYLRALPDRVEHWRTRLPASGLKIGLVWKGNPDHKNDANRSLPHLSTLAPLWKVPGISFISLQKGQGEDQGRQPPPGQPLLHLGDDITDFADTAAIIAQLDLLITVDSAAAHVAGALGKPVWVLLPGVGTDWRWLLDRNDSPWYPGVMRLFRQLREAASWEATVLDIATALRTWSVVPPAPTLPLFQGRFPELPAALLAPATPKPAPAVEVSSAAAEALLQAAHAAYLAGNHDEAESRLHELLVQEPANSAAWNNLASLLTEAGKPAEAEAAYLKAIAFNPAFPDFHVNFAGFLKAQNRPADAETEFREAIALRHDDVNSHNNLGILLLDAARPDAAETSFRSAISIDPNFPEAWNNLGNTLKTLKRADEAEAALPKINRAAPGRSPVPQQPRSISRRKPTRSRSAGVAAADHRLGARLRRRLEQSGYIPTERRALCRRRSCLPQGSRRQSGPRYRARQPR